MMEIYLTITKAIREYFKEKDYEALFLQGGCYWFASLVSSWIPNSYLMINHSREHCAVVVEHRLYDITGAISKEGYKYAEERDLRYMKKHYRVNQNLKPLERFIRTKVEAFLSYQKIYRNEQLNCDN